MKYILKIIIYLYDYIDNLNIHPSIGIFIGGIIGIGLFSLLMILANYLNQ